MEYMAGRPTKYSKKALQDAIKYVEGEWSKGEDVIPTIEALSLHLNAALSTIHLWATKHEAFSDVLDNLKGIQVNLLQNRSIAGTFNSNMSKFILSARHDWREKKDITSGGESFALDEASKERAKKARQQLLGD